MKNRLNIIGYLAKDYKFGNHPSLQNYVYDGGEFVLAYLLNVTTNSLCL